YCRLQFLTKSSGGWGRVEGGQFLHVLLLAEADFAAGDSDHELRTVLAPAEHTLVVQFLERLQAEPAEWLVFIVLADQTGLCRLLDHPGNWDVLVLIAPVPPVHVIPGRVPPEERS